MSELTISEVRTTISQNGHVDYVFEGVGDASALIGKHILLSGTGFLLKKSKEGKSAPALSPPFTLYLAHCGEYYFSYAQAECIVVSAAREGAKMVRPVASYTEEARVKAVLKQMSRAGYAITPQPMKSLSLIPSKEPYIPFSEWVERLSQFSRGADMPIDVLHRQPTHYLKYPQSESKMVRAITFATSREMRNGISGRFEMIRGEYALVGKKAIPIRNLPGMILSSGPGRRNAV
mgnify:FL=1